MSTEPRNWEEVQKALALRGHAKPPPDVLHGFSSRVLEKIAQPPPPPTWWQRLGLELEWTPFLACAGGALMVGLLTLGILLAFRHGKPGLESWQKPLYTVADPAPSGELIELRGVGLPPRANPRLAAPSTAPAISIDNGPFNPFKANADRARYNVGFGDN